MVVDYDLFDELCFMAVGLHEDFGPKELRAYLTRQGWDDPAKVLKRHARWVYMHPGAAMIMKTRILHGPAAYLPHYEPQFYDDGYRMYEPMPKIPRSLLVGREIPERLRGDVETRMRRGTAKRCSTIWSPTRRSTGSRSTIHAMPSGTPACRCSTTTPATDVM